MPKVNPETEEPMTDAPDGPDDLRGGRGPDDPDLVDASENGGTAKPAGKELGDTWSVLPGEKPAEGGEV